MIRRSADKRFACPFCHADSVAVIGRGGEFVHYRCGSCEEVWTGMKFPEPTPSWGGHRPERPKTTRSH
jgi:transcription elongation factor Elf1